METKNPRELQTEGLTSDEKLFCLFCHLSFFFGGLIVPVLIYFLQKSKGKFIAFNSLQAIYFQLSYFIIAVAITGGVAIGFLGGMGVLKDSSSTKGFSTFILANLSIFLFVTFASLIFFGVYSIIVAIKSYEGQIKKYPILGNIAYKQVYGN